jgi:hypothetical protein
MATTVHTAWSVWLQGYISPILDITATTVQVYLYGHRGRYFQDSTENHGHHILSEQFGSTPIRIITWTVLGATATATVRHSSLATVVVSSCIAALIVSIPPDWLTWDDTNIYK